MDVDACVDVTDLGLDWDLGRDAVFVTVAQADVAANVARPAETTRTRRKCVAFRSRMQIPEIEEFVQKVPVEFIGQGSERVVDTEPEDLIHLIVG